MVLRHMAAGFLEAEQELRRISGYQELPFLEAALLRGATGDLTFINIFEDCTFVSQTENM